MQSLKQQFRQQKPFPHLSLGEFFLPKIFREIEKAALSLGFSPQRSDLFQFKQTSDISKQRNPPLALSSFRAFLASEPFISYLEKLSGTRLQRKSFDISASLYEDTDFLLCHDDQLENRKIAFFLYLNTLQKNDGGALQLYETSFSNPVEPVKVAKTITPRANTFAFFLVSDKSFHGVEEVMRPVQRLALSGWFHAAAPVKGKTFAQGKIAAHEK